MVIPAMSCMISWKWYCLIVSNIRFFFDSVTKLGCKHLLFYIGIVFFTRIINIIFIVYCLRLLFCNIGITTKPATFSEWTATTAFLHPYTRCYNWRTWVFYTTFIRNMLRNSNLGNVWNLEVFVIGIAVSKVTWNSFGAWVSCRETINLIEVCMCLSPYIRVEIYIEIISEICL